MHSPTIFAHFLCFDLGFRLRSFIEIRIRRCEGLSPSRASGSARDTMTLIAYVRYDSLSSSSMSWSTMRAPAGFEPSGGGAPPSLSGGGTGGISSPGDMAILHSLL